jgi:hypothetical protein
MHTRGSPRLLPLPFFPAICRSLVAGVEAGKPNLFRTSFVAPSIHIFGLLFLKYHLSLASAFGTVDLIPTHLSKSYRNYCRLLKNFIMPKRENLYNMLSQNFLSAVQKRLSYLIYGSLRFCTARILKSQLAVVRILPNRESASERHA